MKQLQGGSLKKGNSEEAGEWRLDRIQLKKGYNVISWAVMSYRLDTSYNNDLITISHIDVIGTLRADSSTDFLSIFEKLRITYFTPYKS
ncbi:unnamed protein product [Gongylonema pulchrum]|uniref:Elapor1-like galactose binding domain-containing protein n=1 Tax=Gongylonema pulchrum TaxID=637853 RepID=A0A183D4Y1_9BILA|nr:unnamed protein product [Gongylonema pulchrum]